MEISYSDPKFQIRLTGYADTVIIDSGTQQTISAIRFGGYPEVVRALSDAIYGGASVELKQDDTTLYLDCRPKGYRRLLSHDGIYAVATLMANDDSQTEENTADDSDEDVPENPRKCYIFCPPGDRASLFAEVDRKTAAPLIPEFQDYVLDSLVACGDLRQMKVLSFTERMEAWSLTLLPEDQNVTDILEQGLKDGRITIPGAIPDAADGFAEVNSVTSYLNTFGVTVADRIRSQFVPKFDPASEPLSEEILEVNDYIHEKAGYSLYDAQLAVAEAVKRQLCQHKMALIVAECGSGKTKLSAAAAGALNALKGHGTGKSFNLVMCPSHVTGKWVREIAETLPDTYGMVVKSITDVDRLFDLYQRGDKNVYAVFSKERARDGYMRYADTMQAKAMKLMASKLAVAGLIEGTFSEEGLAAMSDVQDMTSQMAKELMLGIKDNVEDIAATFKKMAIINPHRAVKQLPEPVTIQEERVVEVPQPESVRAADTAARQTLYDGLLQASRTGRKPKHTELEDQLSMFDTAA